MELLKLMGIVLFAIGASIFLFGKKFFLLRLYFGDKSMFSQIILGIIVSVIGFIMMFMSGTFN